MIRVFIAIDETLKVVVFSLGAIDVSLKVVCIQSGCHRCIVKSSLYSVWVP